MVESKDQVIKICQTLSHSHDHDVSDRSPEGNRFRSRSTCSMISPAVRFRHAFQTASAEDAAHSTADLCAEAYRTPMILDHQHALNPPLIVTLQE